MSYVPRDRFIQISCATGHVDRLYALDEGGAVWFYNFVQNIWVPMKRDRQEGNQ